MTEELKQKAIDYLCKRFEFTEDIIKHGDWNFLFQKYIEMYIAGATEATKEHEAQIEKMKCCYNCSKWNDGECEESPKSKTFFCADFKCDNWEMFK